MPLSPEWKNLPRRKCDDCGKSYKPVRPKRILNGKEELGFCSANCRKSYHKHGGAYRKLKAEMQKMVERRLEDLHRDLRKIVQDELLNYLGPNRSKDVLIEFAGRVPNSLAAQRASR
jgi:hypothetical protein